MAKILRNAGSYRILAIMYPPTKFAPLELIELAGRTAYQSQDKITKNSAERFVKMLRDRGHESVLEHSAMTVEFNNVSRGFTHELVRHRLASFTQESTRYVDESDFIVVCPPDKDPDQLCIEISPEVLPDAVISFKQWMDLNEQVYRSLRKAGWVPEDARQVLPTAIKSQIVITANFREWRHILRLRTSLKAHWEIRAVMTKLLKELRATVPVVFDDILAGEEHEEDQ